jgi:hypothetical protein
VEREQATTRRSVYRRRLALAAVASVALHLLLAKGLAITHMGVDVAPDSPAATKPLTPKRKADFPLAVPRSPSAEQPAHERPVEVRIPVPDRRQRPPTPRPPDRNVAERQAEERSEWMPAAQPQAARANAARDTALDAAAATPARGAAVASAAPAPAAAEIAAIAPAAAALAAKAPAPAETAPVPRAEPAPIASRWRPREVALLERLTAPQAAPPTRSARDREAGVAARAAPSSRAAQLAADAAAADASAAEIALPTAAATATAAPAPASGTRASASRQTAATARRSAATADDGAATSAAAATAVAVAGGRSARPASSDAAPSATNGAAPGRRQAATAAAAGTGVAAIDLPAATAGRGAAAGGARPAAGGRPAASSPSSALAGGARGATSDADGGPTASSGGAATIGDVGSRGSGTGRASDSDAPVGGGGATPGRATSIASAAGAEAPALVAIAAPARSSGVAAGGGKPAPAAVGRFATGGAATAAGSAVARPRGDAANDADDEGLSVSPGDADLVGGGIAARRSAAGDGPGAAEALPPARVAAAALPAEGRVRDVAEAFARRAPGRRGADREATPADARAATMVERGLDFLSRSQQKDGRWSLGTFAGGTPADVPKLRSDTAATGLALLSFLGAGHDHFDGPHRDTVRRGLEFLLAAQKPDGDLYLPADDLSNSCSWLYSHGIASIALCEAVGMTGDPLVKPAAEKACGFIAASQHPTRGGWRYTPRSDADLSVSGWMLVAVRSGELGGVKTDPRTLAGVRGLLEAAASKTDSGRYAYNPIKPEQRMSPLSSACMTAVGALMRLHTGAAADDPRVVQAARLLAAMPPEYGTATRKTRDSYLWYYASQVLVHTGGPEWQGWYGRLVDTLAATQESSGPMAGSWDPLGPAPDRWGIYGGRIYVTALHLLALEVPDRHLPTYSAAKR